MKHLIYNTKTRTFSTSDDKLSKLEEQRSILNKKSREFLRDHKDDPDINDWIDLYDTEDKILLLKIEKERRIIDHNKELDKLSNQIESLKNNLSNNPKYTKR